MRLLLVHGSLSAYRISRLIKYSFYKNIAFGFLLFYYQVCVRSCGMFIGSLCACINCMPCAHAAWRKPHMPVAATSSALV